jgi:hypothetical protein
MDGGDNKARGYPPTAGETLNSYHHYTPAHKTVFYTFQTLGFSETNFVHANLHNDVIIITV